MIRTILATLFAIAAYGQSSPDIYTWTPVNPALTQPRADACAAALPDGSAIVTGGISTNGDAISSVDLFQPGQGFTSAPAMNSARAGHSCTALRDGHILVAGGSDGHGFPIGTAEIYDPADQTWTVVADLSEPRWGHVAILLHNGRVLIAGGQDADGPKDTLELFEPNASAFATVPVRLSSPRTNLAAALLPDGTVFISGGQTSSGVSAAVDLYVPGKNTVIAGAALLTARASHSANTLSDGTVLIAGGWNGTADLDSVEIYDVHKGSATALTRLATARRGHFALTLPGNGNVLLGAGMAGSSALASCELYVEDLGAFSSTGPLASARARTTVVPVANGMVLSAGGVGQDGVTPISSTGVLAAPTLTWSLVGSSGPYSGDLNIHGRNFPTATPTFILTIANNTNHFSQNVDVVGGNGGNFDIVSTSLNTPAHSGKWTLTAMSPAAAPVRQSQPIVFANVALTSSCNPCPPGAIPGAPPGAAVVNFTAKITNSEPSVFRASPSGSSVTFLDGGAVLGVVPVNAATATAAAALIVPPGNHTITAKVGVNGDGFGGIGEGFVGQASMALSVQQIATTVSVAANPFNVFVGDSVTISSIVSVDPAQLPPGLQKLTPTGTVTYTIFPGPRCDCRFDLPPVATSTVEVGKSPVFFANVMPRPYEVTASYSGDAVFKPSTSHLANPFEASRTTFIVHSPGNLTAFYGDVSFDPPATPGTTSALHWVLRSLQGGDLAAFVFGQSGWIPVAGDWAGIGRSSIGAFDPATDTWHLAGPPSANVAEEASFKFGRAACDQMPASGPPLVPFLGDWTGSGRAGVGVYDPATGSWCLKNSASAGPPDAQFKFAIFSNTIGVGVVSPIGVPADGQTPVVGDWDGNGTTTIGVFDSSQKVFLLRNENSTGAADGGLIAFNEIAAPGVAFCGPWGSGKQTITGVYVQSTDVLVRASSPLLEHTGIAADLQGHQLAGLVSGFISLGP